MLRENTQSIIMKSFVIIICLLVSLFVCKADIKNGFSPQLNDDVLGLVVFKSDLIDPSSYLSSWNEDDESPCGWRFVRCNPRNGRVSELSLDQLGLSGKIGIRGLQKLQHLKVLSLSHNNFTGDLSTPPHLLLPSTLQTLNLSHNSLSGRITNSFLDMNSIRFLDLSNNSFFGPLDDNLFDNCSSLHYLSLAGNFLEGAIPSTLPKCSLLNTLYLSNNRFSGNYPDFANSGQIMSLKRLRKLDLSNNELSGSVPVGISILHNLKEIFLQNNKFSGPLPYDIGLCPHLTKLDFSHNLFTGTLPESLYLLSSLSFISLANNMLTGSFNDRCFSEMISLELIDFSNNGFTGSIPPSLIDCTKLSVIKLGGNRFSGSIPAGLFELGLEVIDFSHNAFTGSIPQGSSKLFESLRVLDLSSNNLKGNKFPEKMGLYFKLRYLNLSWNDLGMEISSEIGLLQNLSVLDLRNSAMYGSVPHDICYSGSLGILQLDGNSFGGIIPEEIGNCSDLYLLSLSHNNLSGPIPNSISKLKKLKILNLEFNELSGEIPQALGNLENLLAVNISYNRLTGRLPVGGIFQSLDESSLQGNLGICSPLLMGPCKMNVPKPLVLDPNGYGTEMGRGGHKQRGDESSGSVGYHRHMFLSISAIIAISAAILIVCGVLVISLLNVSAHKRLAFMNNGLESMCSSSSRSESMAAGGKLILFDSKSSPDWVSNPESLLNKAAEIGEGVFGTVYKVPLGAQGRIVAIKKIVTSDILRHPEDFDREVRILGKAKHPNLITLKGYYWTPQMQLLLTEYASNGSLQAKLHERLPSTPPLSWANRFKILLGTAKGLAHLHHSVCPPIIHYNIKPSNILLDENFNSKISDYGLTRLLTKLDKHVISNRFKSALGYVAPELACQELRVNEKCDIYGFGVMIMELVTGRRPVEYGEDNVVILTDHVRVLLEEGNVSECVDRSMTEYSEDEVFPVLKLALVCTSQIPSSRPSMLEVVQILQFIKTPVPQR